MAKNFRNKYQEFLEEEIKRQKAPEWSILCKCWDQLNQDKVASIMVENEKDGVYYIEKVNSTHRLPNYLLDNIKYFMELQGYKPLF
ncbi:MAG: hypothetical protein ACOCQR_03925 [bacterium]